ncbi:iron-sulfur cluster assembly accessory protein [Flaviaesturariibacter flavus]|uniref:Iron-sulfur cluster assembly accessory protein n=1 Tax=Flaviaesturariibacter flavus TaxID=2502780 RepID=A0A4R1BA35_9BACT|nr:iron-sulfur cluster assembly accessory protein [Flaviaesturariibacter flavus]TCJ13793.1 iron-sulfur cluster assembly accessory protein [Flaviaesturariibacter flavus]
METTIIAPVSFTASAAEEIRRLQAEPGFDTSKELRIGVKGGGCSGMSYVLEFDQRTDKDASYETEGIHFIMDRSHELYLFGVKVDWENGLNNRGFTFINPNASTTCGCGSSFAV